MQIIKLTTQNQSEVIGQTISVLKAGGLVVFPSDTVYGLLADAGNPEAVSKLLQFKERRPGHAISIFVADQKMAEKYIVLNPNAKNVIDNLLPGPFTIVAESRHQTNKRLEAENGTIGIRIPQYIPINRLCQAFGSALTATSANLSGKPPYHSISALLSSLSLKKKILLDLVIEAGRLPHNQPSTVIDTTSGQLKTLRTGDILPKTATTFLSHSEKATFDLGRFLAAKFGQKCSGKPIVFLLEGELGSGKTVIAKGIGNSLGIKAVITSPTYNLCHEYTYLPLIDSDTERSNHKISLFVHYDLYRLEQPEELAELRFLENFRCGNIYAVEWPERIPAEMISALTQIAEIIYVRLKHLSENQREISWGNLKG